jgi:hypothetical protein
MSVKIKVLHERNAEGREYAEPAFRDGSFITEFPGVIGHVLALVVRQSDGSITLERDIAVNADNIDDNEVAESVVKTIERKLNEAFPDPNKQEPEVKLWVPDGY